MAPEVILQADHIVGGYGRVVVLHGVSVAAQRGQIMAIIGPNGSGKSTLLKILAGALNPFSGRITFHGEDITGLAPHILLRKGIMYMPQGPRVFPRLSVRENLQMGGYSLPTKAAVQEGLERVYRLFPELGHQQARWAATLSGGQRAMVSFGMAMVSRPQVILLDEPSAGLAPRALSSVFDHIKELNARGMVFVIVEQNIRKVMELAHQVYIIDRGRNVFVGPPTELMSRQDLMRLYLRL